MCIVHSGSRSRPHHLELAQFVREISGYNWPYPSVSKFQLPSPAGYMLRSIHVVIGFLY